VLVVDDEPIARRRLLRMLASMDDMEVAGEAADGEEALEKIEKLAPDVLLLDIRMPGLDGLSLARRRRAQLPPVIFITAHAEFAVEAFASEAVDYLLKPVERGRLEEALRRARRRSGIDPARLEALLARLTGSDVEPRLMAHSRGSTFFFDPRQISRIDAGDKYTGFSHRGKRYLLDDSMSSLEGRLAQWGFLRVSRSELVNVHFVRALHRTDRGIELELEGGQRVFVSRRRTAAVVRRLGLERSR
jgi:DNA-binding LytR/AlgR family response regulator